MSLPRRMKATILHGPNDLRIEEVDVPEPGPHEVIIKVRVDGICPSGIRAVKSGRQWGPPGIRLPGFPGHEFSGEVEAVGPHVEGIKVGDRVVADTIIRCGRCYYCKVGRSNLCISTRNSGYYSWAEYMKVYDFQVYKVPDHVSYEAAAFTEPLACAFNGVEQANIRPGDDVVVIGAGPMGLLISQLVKNIKGARVIVSDLIDNRLEVASKLGADYVINPDKQNVAERVKNLTDNLGANAVIVTIGSIKAIESSFELVRPAGTIVFFAGMQPDVEPVVRINPNFIHYKEINITGAYDKTPYQFGRALKFISQGLVKVEPLITHKVPLEKVHEGIKIVEEKKGLKVMVYPHGLF